jgi:hypothetical protein
VSAPLPAGAYTPIAEHPVGGRGRPVVEFEGEDRRRRTFDFADLPLPGWHTALAEALAQRIGPGGGLRTSTSSLGAWNNLRNFLRFLAERPDHPDRPSDLTIDQVEAYLTAQVTRLGPGYGGRAVDHVWRVLRLEPVASQIDKEIVGRLRLRAVGSRPAGTPGYSDQELKLILDTARSDVVRLRERLRATEDLLRRYNQDQDQLCPADRQEAQRLAEMAKSGLAPPDGTGANTFLRRQGLAEPLFVTRRDVPALLILLVATTGWNIETIKEFPAEHRVLEGRAVEVRLTKRRRGAGNWFHTATWEIGPSGRPLDHPGGLYLLLHDLMARGRGLSEDPSSFWAVWRNVRRNPANTVNEIRNPFRAALTAGIEVRAWAIDQHGLRGDDAMALSIDFKRLRTSVEVRRTRALGGHLPSAARSNTVAVLFSNYLRGDPVAREWAHDITDSALADAEKAALDALPASPFVRKSVGLGFRTCSTLRPCPSFRASAAIGRWRSRVA